MTLVCPSRWMATCARESALFESNPVHCLPNPLDLDRWKPADRQNSRKLLGLPMDKRVVLFGAIGGESDLRKGADLLRLALEKLRERNKDIHLVVFGQSEPQKLVPFAYPVTFLGRLRDDFSLIAAYSAADVMVVPSRQEAFGQTASEAHACGAPVVAFDVGGLSDIVSHQRSGYLAKPFDTDDLAEGIASVLGNEEKSKAMSKIVRDDALRRFAMPVVANGYYEVYKNILS